MNLIYQTEPGIYADVIFSHLLHFNIDSPENLEKFANPKKSAADLRFFRECLARFDAPANELCVFFEIIGHRSFAFVKLYNRLCQHRELSPKALASYFPDAQSILCELMRFYLENAADEALGDLKAAATHIAALDASDAVKFHMLAMCVDPVPYYEKLVDSINTRQRQMKAYHKEHRDIIEQTRRAITQQEVASYLEACHQLSPSELPEELTYSVMLVGKNSLRFVGGEQALMVLGSDYSARMARKIGEMSQPDLTTIGKALSEEKRVMILQILLGEEEITAQQLLRKLELSMTATHYHLDMLLQAGMLLARNEGRTIYYSLNREFFDRVPMVFDKYNSKEDFEQ